MDTENKNSFGTVIIEGEVWAVTSGEEGDLGTASESAAESSTPGDETVEAQQGTEDSGAATDSDSPQSQDEPESTPAPDEGEAAETVNGPEEEPDTEEEPDFDELRALTRLLVGGAIEGTSQLTTRLKKYQEDLRREAAENAVDETITSEDDLDRLRYALVGLIFDAQDSFRRNVTLWAKLADRSARATNQMMRPVTNSFLLGPFQRRYERFIQRGEESLVRWIADGRTEEPQSRKLAYRTYVEIVDEFIDRLSENPQLQELITEQSLGVASEIRDEVRERTVTGDIIMEGIVRRILRRAPRTELPEPPPEVQRWAGLTLEEYKAQTQQNEGEDETS